MNKTFILEIILTPVQVKALNDRVGRSLSFSDLKRHLLALLLADLQVIEHDFISNLDQTTPPDPDLDVGRRAPDARTQTQRPQMPEPKTTGKRNV